MGKRLNDARALADGTLTGREKETAEANPVIAKMAADMKKADLKDTKKVKHRKAANNGR